MKKLILCLTMCFLTSCVDFSQINNTSENTNTKHSIYINCEDVFKIRSTHFCYFFLAHCSACNAIKDQIEYYAKEHSDFFIVEAPLDFQKGIKCEDSIGVMTVEEIKFLGFPTLIFIENNKLKEMYVGIRDISAVLF